MTQLRPSARINSERFFVVVLTPRLVTRAETTADATSTSRNTVDIYAVKTWLITRPHRPTPPAPGGRKPWPGSSDVFPDRPTQWSKSGVLDTSLTQLRDVIDGALFNDLLVVKIDALNNIISRPKPEDIYILFIYMHIVFFVLHYCNRAVECNKRCNYYHWYYAVEYTVYMFFTLQVLLSGHRECVVKVRWVHSEHRVRTFFSQSSLQRKRADHDDW